LPRDRGPHGVEHGGPVVAMDEAQDLARRNDSLALEIEHGRPALVERDASAGDVVFPDRQVGGLQRHRQPVPRLDKGGFRNPARLDVLAERIERDYMAVAVDGDPIAPREAADPTVRGDHGVLVIDIAARAANTLEVGGDARLFVLGNEFPDRTPEHLVRPSAMHGRVSAIDEFELPRWTGDGDDVVDFVEQPAKLRRRRLEATPRRLERAHVGEEQPPGRGGFGGARRRITGEQDIEDAPVVAEDLAGHVDNSLVGCFRSREPAFDFAARAGRQKLPPIAADCLSRLSAEPCKPNRARFDDALLGVQRKDRHHRAGARCRRLGNPTLARLGGGSRHGLRFRFPTNAISKDDAE